MKYKTWEDRLPFKNVSVREQNFKFAIPNFKALYVAKTINEREPELYDWIDDYIKPGAIFLDVGANYGQFSIYAALKKKCNIYAFEPHFASYYILNRNAIANNLTEYINIYPLALSDSKFKTSSFRLNDILAGQALNTLLAIEENPEDKSKKINKEDMELARQIDEMNIKLQGKICRDGSLLQSILAMNLDSFFGSLNEKLSLKLNDGLHLKIDVDGFDFLVLAGARELLPKINSIMVEYFPERIHMHKLIVPFLAEFGFQVVSRTRGNLLLLKN